MVFSSGVAWVWVLVLSLLSSPVSGRTSSASKEYVTALTSETIDQFLSNDLVLIEFYAPWCSACQGFERTYQLIGKSLQQDGFSIGKVNIDESQALVSRFNVRYLPTLYLIRNEQVYLYDGANSFESVVNFATQDYKDTKPVPYFSSPLGPVGSIKGLLTRLGIALVNIQPFLMEELGVSQFVSYVLTAFFFGGLVVTLVSIGVYLQVILSGHAKRD